MKVLGWMLLGGGISIQTVLPLRWLVPPDALWFGTPSTVVLMFGGLISTCLGGLALYRGPLSERARALDAEVAAADGEKPR
jgi:hypothetical protein